LRETSANPIRSARRSFRRRRERGKGAGSTRDDGVENGAETSNLEMVKSDKGLDVDCSSSNDHNTNNVLIMDILVVNTEKVELTESGVQRI
jgi:hypothetical protein